MPLSEHDEIEAKLDATGVSLDGFKQFVAQRLDFYKFERIVGPDHYFKSGANVVRHRMDRRDGRHELTVKRRKSEGSTRDRQEIDLHFSKRTQPRDVDAFLRATGFTPVFTIVKEAHIFWVELSPKLTATFVLYEAWREDEPEKKRRFVEVEAEKGSDVAPETAKRHVNQWVKALQQEFGLAEPLNESLWEIFSGERYQLVQ